MIEKIVHTAKQTVKAIVDMESARVAGPGRGRGMGSLIRCSMGGVGGAALWLKTKKLPARPLASVHPGCAEDLIGSFAWWRPSLDANAVARLWACNYKAGTVPICTGHEIIQ